VATGGEQTANMFTAVEMQASGVQIYTCQPKKDDAITIAFVEGTRVLRSFTTKLPNKDPDEAFEPGDEGPGHTEKAIELKAGVNRIVWDMRDEEPSLIQPTYVFGDYPPQGVRVTPGRYTVRVTGLGKTHEAPIEIVPNPTASTPAADLTAQYSFLTTVRRDVETIHDTLRQIKDVKDQVKRYGKRAAAAGKGDALKSAADAIVKAFEPIEADLYNPKLQTSQDSLNYLPKLDFQFTALAGMADTAEVKPTVASHARYRELKVQLDAILVRVKAVMDTDVDAFNRAVKDLAMPAVIVGPGRR
jgi:hypothetical protein